jgi:hypothetical protein
MVVDELMAKGMIVAYRDDPNVPQQYIEPSCTPSSSTPSFAAPAPSPASTLGSGSRGLNSSTNAGGSLLVHWGPMGIWCTSGLVSVLAAVAFGGAF